MREVVIAPVTGKKGRSFAAYLLASVEADALWTGGSTATEDSRPVWAQFAGSEAEMRPFIANLQSGRKALYVSEHRSYRRKQKGVEFLKSSGYRYTWQREAEGAVVTAYLPELFLLDPGMVDPAVVRFLLLPAADWIKAQVVDPAPAVEHALKLGVPLPEAELRALVPIAYLFSAYLDRRTRAPLLADARFYIQLTLACLKAGLASWAADPDGYRYRQDRPFGRHPHHKFVEEGTSDVGVLPGIAFSASHEELEALLATEVSRYFQLTEVAPGTP